MLQVQNQNKIFLDVKLWFYDNWLHDNWYKRRPDIFIVDFDDTYFSCQV